MAFPESFLQELTQRNEISEVVSAYVKLNKKSGSNLFGLCPFHNEKTPSFSVAPDKQIYHCFGCGKGGGVVNFIMEIENLSYPDAVRFLARRAGMAVPEDRPDETVRKRERMLELNRDSARFFYERLVGQGSQTAQQYLEKRQISPAMVTRFGLGFAPDSWDSLCKAMQQKGYTKVELLEAGLARASKKGDGGIYDTFRNRLMFPVIDVRGSVVAFSGRILGDGEPKYMNSPETMIFSKSRNLFAMNLAKKSKKGYIILSEGNIDVVALHQAGFDCAVASLGTSLTAEQARLIANSQKEEVIIIYDGDAAGQKATQRAINILGQLNLKVRVVRLTGAKDPDEFIKTFGQAAFENLLSRAENNKQYLLADIAAKYDLSADQERISFLKDATEYVAGFWSDVEKEVYARNIADMAKVSYEAVAKEIERRQKGRLRSAKSREEREETRPVRMAQPREKTIKFENMVSAAAEKGVISLLYYEPGLAQQAAQLKQEDFSSPLLWRLFQELEGRALSGQQPSVTLLAESFTGEEISLLTEILQAPQELSNSGTALEDYIQTIKTQALARRLRSGDGETDLKALAEKMRQSKQYGGKDNG